MSNSNNIPTFKMSLPQSSSSSSSDITDVTPPQFRMSNQPRSASYGSHSFKRTRVPQSKSLNHPPPKRRTGHLFFKTRICTKFDVGSCRNGENCTFAHGVDEIRQPPPNWQELVGPRKEERVKSGGRRNDDERIIQKMKLCKKYCNGEICPYGDNCSFLHEVPAKFRDDFRKTRECFAISIETCNNLEGSGAGSIEAEAAKAIANSTKAGIPTLPTTGSSANNAPTLPASVLAGEEGKEGIILWK